MKAIAMIVRGLTRPSLIAITLLLAAAAHAKIDLVTLPERDTTELTIYNSQDLTLTREARTLSFTKGMNDIQFSWANTLIDPTSLQIDLKGAKGLVVQDAVYPGGTKDLIVWHIEAEENLSSTIEISYFTSGLSWSANYILRANREETQFDLQQFTTIRNNSGEDFDRAHTRVVVGEINLIQLVADLARRGMVINEEDAAKAAAYTAVDRIDMAAAMGGAMAAPSSAAREEAKQIIKKAVSEYFLFAVEGEENIQTGWGKQLPNPQVGAIPFDLSYEIDPHRFGAAAVKFYKLKNDAKHKLGNEPLPEGQYYAYRDDGRKGLGFEGSVANKYVPVGEDIELNFGSDGMLLYKERVMSSKRGDFEFNSSGNITGWVETRNVELEVKNARDRNVPLKLTHYIDGDWDFTDASDKSYTKVDRGTVRWESSVGPLETKIFKYTATVRFGTKARS
ncbi:hypothetical protein BH09SUM1_BH09SUM1_03580 [soil metagenome]